MAKLFDEIFRTDGSGDMELVVSDECREPPAAAVMVGAEATVTTLRCHSLILTHYPYFLKMLERPLREGRTRTVHIEESCEEFVELIRYIYTGHVYLSRGNVGGLLTLADKYCIDEVVDLCLKHIGEIFDADVFFNFYGFMSLHSAYQERIKDQLMGQLRKRTHLCAIAEDERWSDLPIGVVEEILSLDELPIASEAEVLTLISRWIGDLGRSKGEIARLMGAFRRCGNLYVRVADVSCLMQALGVDVFSAQSPRNGAAVWDPSFVLHRHESAGPVPLAPIGSDPQCQPLDPSERECTYQLGCKDFLQQEPGWTHPGVHRCRITLTCNAWSHRERRLNLLGRNPMEAAALQKRVFDSCSSHSRPSGHERSPSPPPAAFQVRMPPIDSRESFDISDGSEQGVLGSGASSVMRSHVPSRELHTDHEVVEHQIICGVLSGHQRHGVRFAQRERNAIYILEDLLGKQFVNIGGTTSSVSFELELKIGKADKCGISRCRFAVIRNSRTLLEEWFHVSARVPLRFYISSSYFDKNSSYAVSFKWLRPVEPQVERIRSISQDATSTVPGWPVARQQSFVIR
eukprot:TRINITY_DN28445_c0_g1_i1.p1 TRINITY_DN28445_c0_g1~~TRINITY_DN28445_c0_g1_i1.p1  ORF type:complete len:574 (+),score=81.25 TRINITY_DN28445_c0_g1_i1:53-1774(+)